MHKFNRMILALFFFAVSSNLFAQDKQHIDNIDRYCYGIDTLKNKAKKTSLRVDSISIDIRQTKSKIIALCRFDRSKKQQTISYYLKDNNLLCTHVVERKSGSYFMPNVKLYYRNNRLFDEKHYWTSDGIPCFGFKFEDLTPITDIAFVKIFVLKLFDKIKLVR